MNNDKKKVRPSLDPHKLRPIDPTLKAAKKYGDAYAAESQRRAENGDYSSFR